MKTIFVVDDNSTNLMMADEVLSEHYEVITMLSASTMFELFEKVIPDLILLDIMMPDMNGFDALKLIKANPRYADIPIVFLTSKTDSETETLGFKMGIIDIIPKPFAGPVVLNRIKAILYKEN